MIGSIGSVLHRIEDIEKRIGEIRSLGKINPVKGVKKFHGQKTGKKKENTPKFSEILNNVMKQQLKTPNVSQVRGINLGKVNDTEKKAMMNEWLKSVKNSKQDLNGIIEEAALKNKLDPNLIKAVIKQESQFTPDAVSPKGAMGYMQLMPRTASLLKVNNAFDPKENIMGGSEYLSMLMNKYKGDVVKALAAYNAGPNAVDRAGGIPNINETKDYVNKVLNHYYEYSRLENSGLSGDLNG